MKNKKNCSLKDGEMLDRDKVYNLMHRICYTDEQVEEYVERFMDFYNRSMILNNTRRECIEEFLPVFIGVYELGIHAHDSEIMKVRKIVNGLPL